MDLRRPSGRPARQRKANPAVRTGEASADSPLNLALRSQLEQMVATAYRLDASQLRQQSRGRQTVARARQTAMYLAHTVCGLSLTETGVIFERDRTTVAHACAVVEDRREDPSFDRAIEMLERSTRIVHFHTRLPSLFHGVER